MKRSERGGMSEGVALRPIGLAMSAVVAGLAPGAAAGAEAAPPPPARERAHAVDPSNHPDFERAPELILGPSSPVEPFAEAPKPKQADLFDL